MFKPLLLAALLFATAAPVGADNGERAEAAIEIDLERARMLREQAAALRSEAETRFRVAEPACYERFLVNRCLDNARRERLDAIRQAREMEIESRRIELADKRRQAEEAGLVSGIGAPPPEPAPSTVPSAMTDDEAQALRERRAAEARRAEAQAREERQLRDARRAEERARSAEEAQRRADRAAADAERRERRFEERSRED